MADEALVTPLRDWLVEKALGDTDIVELFETVCMRLVGAGVPLTRGRLVWPTLHPLFQAETVVWDRGQEATLEQFLHQDEQSDAWLKSPIRFTVENGLTVVRRRLTGEDALADFPLLEELREQGFTDYLILSTKLDGNAFTNHRNEQRDRGVIATYATDRVGGFSSDNLDALQRVQSRLAVASKTVIQDRIALNVAQTYLGKRAGTRVLSGQIRRGDGEKTQAVVWYSDMRNSTALAEQLPPSEYFELLNSFFTTSAEPLVEEGGELLDFIGDAVLAIFPFTTEQELKEASKAANRALERVCKAALETRKERQRAGKHVFDFGVGIDVGEVLFGNIGIPSRLSFSVIGPSVNGAARIEKATKATGKQILASQDYAKLNPDQWQTIGSHTLSGISGELELYEWTGV